MALGGQGSKRLPLALGPLRTERDAENLVRPEKSSGMERVVSLGDLPPSPSRAKSLHLSQRLAALASPTLRIGVATGPVAARTVGAAERQTYTIYGNQGIAPGLQMRLLGCAARKLAWPAETLDGGGRPLTHEATGLCVVATMAPASGHPPTVSREALGLRRAVPAAPRIAEAATPLRGHSNCVLEF